MGALSSLSSSFARDTPRASLDIRLAIPYIYKKAVVPTVTLKQLLVSHFATSYEGHLRVHLIGKAVTAAFIIPALDNDTSGCVNIMTSPTTAKRLCRQCRKFDKNTTQHLVSNGSV